MLMKTKRVLTVTLAAATLATASLALADDAFAGGGGGRHGHHFHKFHGGGFFYSPVTSSCWKWINYKKVWVCY